MIAVAFREVAARVDAEIARPEARRDLVLARTMAPDTHWIIAIRGLLAQGQTPEQIVERARWDAEVLARWDGKATP